MNRKLCRPSVFLILCVLLFAAVVSARSQVQPDLIVRRVSLTRDATGLFVNKVTVHVSNGCMNSTAAASYVLVTFRETAAPGSKAIFYVGNTVKPLKGGESHIQTFDVSQKKIGVGRHIFAEADPYKKVAEASEDNNWFTVNPYGAATQLTQGQCSPKT